MGEGSTTDGTGGYEIRIQGRLDSRWATWFDGLSVRTDGDGTTVIHGPVVDQSELHGLLRKVRDIGLPLISVTRLNSEQAAALDPQGNCHPSPPPTSP